MTAITVDKQIQTEAIAAEFSEEGSEMMVAMTESESEQSLMVRQSMGTTDEQHSSFLMKDLNTS